MQVRLLIWLLGVGDCLLGFEITRHQHPGWVWVWWTWLALWMIAGAAVLVFAAIAAVKRSGSMLRGGQPAAPRPTPAQSSEGE